MEWLVESLLGTVIAKFHQWYRFAKIRKHAPSAKMVSFHVRLTQHDYDRLPKKEDNVVYLITG